MQQRAFGLGILSAKFARLENPDDDRREERERSAGHDRRDGIAHLQSKLSMPYTTYVIGLMDNDGPSVACQAGSIAVEQRSFRLTCC